MSLVVAASCGGSERATSRTAPTGDPAGAAIDPQFGLLPASVPDGMRVDVASARPTAYRPGFSALYADDAWMANGGGRAVAVLMEMDYTSLPVDFQAAPTTTIGDLPAIEGVAGDLRFVAWQFCPPSGCDHAFDAAIVGHGLTPAELLAIARGVELERDDSSIGWLPDDLVERARGPYAASGLGSMADGYGPISTRLVLERRDRRPHEARIEIVTTSDPRQIHLARFLLDEPPIAIRGVKGSHGSLTSLGAWPGDGVADAVWAWVEGGVLTLVQARGVDDQIVEALIEDLRPADAAMWDTMADRAAEIPHEPESNDRIAASESFERGSWTIVLSRFQADGRTFCDLSDSVRFADGFTRGGSSSITLAVPAIAFSSSDHGTLFFGALPNEYTNITITLEGRKTLTITPPLRDGWPARPWGAFTTGRPRATAAAIWRGDDLAYRLASKTPQPDGHGGSGLNLEPVLVEPG